MGTCAPAVFLLTAVLIMVAAPCVTTRDLLQEVSTFIPDATVSDTSGDADSFIPKLYPGSPGDRQASATAYCGGNNGRIIWALATAGGRSCPAACRGYNGATSAALVAINGGVSSQPSYLCRTGDASFMQNRAGFSQMDGSLAGPCYAYSRNPGKILAGGRMNCACVADPTRSSFQGCKQPVWVATKSGDCASVCPGAGNRAAIPDAPGAPKYVCRPENSMRIGWAAPEGGRNACHYATNNVVTNFKGFSAQSVYVYSYDCLCI